MSVYRQPVAWAPVSTMSTLLGRHNRSNVSPSSNAFIIGMRGVTENKFALRATGRVVADKVSLVLSGYFIERIHYHNVPFGTFQRMRACPLWHRLSRPHWVPATHCGM